MESKSEGQSEGGGGGLPTRGAVALALVADAHLPRVGDLVPVDGVVAAISNVGQPRHGAVVARPEDLAALLEAEAHVDGVVALFESAVVVAGAAFDGAVGLKLAAPVAGEGEGAAAGHGEDEGAAQQMAIHRGWKIQIFNVGS